MQLTAKQTQFLRALAHPLKPLVQVGNKGISDTLILQIAEQLVAHELIKVRFNTESVDPSEVMDVVVERTESQLVQKLGRTLVLYKRNEETPKVELPGKVRKAQIAERPERGRGRVFDRSRGKVEAGLPRRGGRPSAGPTRRGGKPSAGPTRRDGKLSSAAGRRRAKVSVGSSERAKPKASKAPQQANPKPTAPPARKVGGTTSYQRRQTKATAQAAHAAFRGAASKRAERSAPKARSAAPAGTRTRVRKAPPRRRKDDDS